MNTLEIQPAITLIKVKFPEIKVVDENLVAEPVLRHMNLEHRVLFDDKQPNRFWVDFKLSLHSEDQQFSMLIKMLGFFSTNLPIDEAFRASTLAQINAPAIAFPYLRSFVSTMSVNAGYNNIILPSINFIPKDK